MIKLDELPQSVGKTISREFLYWLIQAFNRINEKLDLITVSSAGNVVETAGTGEVADSGKATPTGAFVGTTDNQVLTNKTLTAPTIADFTNAGHDHQDADDGGKLDHGAALNGLADDDHAGYLWLTGRAGGQTLNGGTASGDDITFGTTAHVTKGSYIFSEMTVAGFLKNTAGGVVTGGNSASLVLNIEEFNDTDTLDTANDIAICNKGSAMTLNLPEATATAKVYYVKNIGAGVVTLEGNGAETIDGAANQTLNQWDAMTVADYAAGKWAIL